MNEVSVLVAVANADLRRRTTAALGQKRYSVTEVRAGKTLVRCLREKKPQVLVVADPTRAKLEQVRSTSPGTAVITFCERVDPRASSSALSLADDFVVQPFEPGELQVRVDRAIRHKGLTRVVAPRRKPGTRRAATVLPELHDPHTGRLDAKRVADYLDVPLARLAAAIGKGYKAVFKSPSSAALQPLLAPIHSLLLALRRVYGDRRETLVWLNTPHGELGGVQPLALVLGGRAEVVADLVEGALAGVTT
jgi:CheY-like chemotaxis protein